MTFTFIFIIPAADFLLAVVCDIKEVLSSLFLFFFVIYRLNFTEQVFMKYYPSLLEKEMATHSSILAWRISWRKEPGGLQSTGPQRVGHD